MKTTFYTPITKSKLEQYGLRMVGDDVYHNDELVVLIGQSWEGIDFVLCPRLKKIPEGAVFVITDVNCGYPGVTICATFEKCVTEYVKVLCTYNNPFGDRAKKEVRVFADKPQG